MRLDETLEKPWSYYKNWRYKNTAFLVLSMLTLYYFADSAVVKGVINHIGNLGYIGAFLSGIFFVSIFTVAPSAVILFHIAESYNPLWTAIIAGVGAVVGDYIIFRFLRDRIFQELHPLIIKMEGKHLRSWFSSPYFSWLIPFIGAFIIASPLPDEIGIGMLGLSKIKNWQFLGLSFALNSLGIFLTVLLARAI